MTDTGRYGGGGGGGGRLQVDVRPERLLRGVHHVEEAVLVLLALVHLGDGCGHRHHAVSVHQQEEGLVRVQLQAPPGGQRGNSVQKPAFESAPTRSSCSSSRRDRIVSTTSFLGDALQWSFLQINLSAETDRCTTRVVFLNVHFV